MATNFPNYMSILDVMPVRQCFWISERISKECLIVVLPLNKLSIFHILRWAKWRIFPTEAYTTLSNWQQQSGSVVVSKIQESFAKSRSLVNLCVKVVFSLLIVHKQTMNSWADNLRNPRELIIINSPFSDLIKYTVTKSFSAHTSTKTAVRIAIYRRTVSKC